MSDLNSKICHQVEFYFCDVNIAKDVFLKSKMAEDAEGFVPLEVLLTFKRLSALTTDVKVLAEALRDSDKLVVKEDGSAVRRKDPLPESINTDEQTVYAKPVSTTATLDELREFFAKHGTVLAVWRRYFKGGKKDGEESSSNYKPSVFVVYSSKEEAEKLKQNPPEVDGAPMTILLKGEYMQAKAAEIAEKNKGRKAAAKPADDYVSRTPAMPTNSSYRVSGAGEYEGYTAVKGLWPAEEQKGIRYVFKPSNDVSMIIFQDPETAEKMVQSLKDRSPSLNGKQPVVES
ncbi:lupus La protein [Angomonas deanei]|nr:lupus La protein [Angomonas deanei]|eukprot:EPY38561.1 lupus La protein [Angomonas deanei]